MSTITKFIKFPSLSSIQKLKENLIYSVDYYLHISLYICLSFMNIFVIFFVSTQKRKLLSLFKYIYSYVSRWVCHCYYYYFFKAFFISILMNVPLPLLFALSSLINLFKFSSRTNLYLFHIKTVLEKTRRYAYHLLLLVYYSYDSLLY